MNEMKNRKTEQMEEHILVCLSSAPSNAKIIHTAAKMAEVFEGEFTALFVETSAFDVMKLEDRERLRSNMKLAQSLGANIETIYGEDVPLLIAEFARISRVTKIVIGRSSVTKRGLFHKPTLTERLIAEIPNLDVHIIPDGMTMNSSYKEVKRKNEERLTIVDFFKSIAILIVVSLIGHIFDIMGLSDVNIITVYILGVLLTSIVTNHRIYCAVASLVSVIVFNFLFTQPRYTLLAYDNDYPVTFLVMFVSSFITGSLAVKLKQIAKQSVGAAYRTKILLDTNQILGQTKDRTEIAKVAAQQIMKLLDQSVVIYLVENDALSEPYVFMADHQETNEDYISETEREVARWVKSHNRYAGKSTDTFPNAKCIYYAIRIKDTVYGVVGIALKEDTIDSFEHNILLSILGEIALVMENEKNAREKELAAILAKNEQLRANLLRTISHDLRTPLTSISGNASILLQQDEYFTQEMKNQLCKDIYDDSIWLINLVENILSITRLEDGKMELRKEVELLDDVIREALKHVKRGQISHEIIVEHIEDLMFIKADIKLTIQVLINLIDNAVKYTPEGTQIIIKAYRKEKEAVIQVSDNGIGIADEEKEHVFDMFYSGSNKIADSRRSLGLGLFLCKSIVSAHGGIIKVTDNVPRGTVFTFTLPIEEVDIHE